MHQLLSRISSQENRIPLEIEILVPEDLWRLSGFENFDFVLHLGLQLLFSVD
jgi:hypothetical protein